MLRPLVVLVALCWAACVLFRSVPAGQSVEEGTHARPHQLQRAMNIGASIGWRRLLAVQVRVIVV